MKKKNIIFCLTLAFICFPLLIYAQQGGGDLISKINGWKATLLLVSRSVISVGAIGGGVYTYFKVQSDDGGSGKKAIGNFALFIGLLFVLWVFTELFLS